MTGPKPTRQAVQTDLIVDVVYGSAQLLTGSELADDELVRIVKEEFADRRVCIVRQWLLLDLLMPEVERSRIEDEGLQPTVLYAHNVVFDTHGLIPAAGAVVTQYERESFGYLFEAGGVLFLLAGRGGRKYAGQPAITALRDPVAVRSAGLAVCAL